METLALPYVMSRASFTLALNGLAIMSTTAGPAMTSSATHGPEISKLVNIL